MNVLNPTWRDVVSSDYNILDFVLEHIKKEDIIMIFRRDKMTCEDVLEDKVDYIVVVRETEHEYHINSLNADLKNKTENSKCMFIDYTEICVGDYVSEFIYKNTILIKTYILESVRDKIINNKTLKGS